MDCRVGFNMKIADIIEVSQSLLDDCPAITERIKSILRGDPQPEYVHIPTEYCECCGQEID